MKQSLRCLWKVSAAGPQSGVVHRELEHSGFGEPYVIQLDRISRIRRSCFHKVIPAVTSEAGNVLRHSSCASRLASNVDQGHGK